MLLKRYEPTEVDRRTWLHVPSGTRWSNSSDTHVNYETSNVVDIFEHGCSYQCLQGPSPSSVEIHFWHIKGIKNTMIKLI